MSRLSVRAGAGDAERVIEQLEQQFGDLTVQMGEFEERLDAIQVARRSVIQAMRKVGLSYTEIGARLGFTKQRAQAIATSKPQGRARCRQPKAVAA